MKTSDDSDLYETCQSCFYILDSFFIAVTKKERKLTQERICLGLTVSEGYSPKPSWQKTWQQAGKHDTGTVPKSSHDSQVPS